MGEDMRRSRRKRVHKQKEERNKTIRKSIRMILIAVLLVAAADLGYIAVMHGKFYHHATLNGYDVSGKTVDEVMQILEGPYNGLKLQVTEQGQTVLDVDFADMGYSVNEDQMRRDIEEVMGRQSPVVFADLLLGDEYGMRIPFVIDQTVFADRVSADRLTVPRVDTENAQLTEENGSYVIKPEVYGNDFEDSWLQELVKKTIDRELTNVSIDTVIKVEITEDAYQKPTVFQDDPKLNEEMNLYNRFCKAEITYDFGEEKVVLGWDTLKDWLVPENSDNPVSEEAIYNYASQLAAEYDTIYITRTFETSRGYTVTLPSNDYGFQIDVDAEFDQLKADIYANAPVEREPVYAVRGYSRNGHDDLNGTYVEVDLTGQYLWFYKNGDLIVESSVVTGLPKDGRETAEGAFAIPYKASPFNLVGGGGEGEGDAWDVEVRYWMPFHDGQGLHDADWRGSFGGNIYQTSGSHGCVNLPVDVAAVIYEYMEENVAVILYK